MNFWSKFIFLLNTKIKNFYKKFFFDLEFVFFVKFQSHKGGVSKIFVHKKLEKIEDKGALPRVRGAVRSRVNFLKFKKMFILTAWDESPCMSAGRIVHFNVI